MLFVAVFSVLCFFLCSPCDSSQNLPPVILIPGIGASRLEAKLNRTSTSHFLCEKTSSGYFPLWFSFEFLIPVVKDCWMDNIKLEYDNVTRATRSPAGVDVRVPGFGDPRSVEWLDEEERLVAVYQPLANALVDVGYVRNKSLRGAPYDFRKGPSESGEFFSNLKKLVEDTFELNGGTRVLLMTHSMGSPMAAIFLKLQTQSWKDQYMQGLVSLNGVFAGTLKGIITYIMGDDLDEFFIPKKFVKELEVSSSSLPVLMPFKEIWNDTVLVETPMKNYTMENIREFFVDIGYDAGWEMFQDQLPYLTLDPPGVDVYCLYGTGVQTVSSLSYKRMKDFPNNPEFKYGGGDGSVNLESLQSCTLWNKLQKQKVNVQTFAGLNHYQIIKDKKSLKYISELLLNIAQVNRQDLPLGVEH